MTYRRILRLWLPLAATWLMMSVEGPFLAAVIARLPNPVENLAAYGVAFSFATLAEAPIIMILSASTALVKDLDSYHRLKRFSRGLNLAVTIVILVGLLPPIFDRVAQGWIGLPESVAGLTHQALALLVPWPAAIGYRRFFQGILIRQGRTRRVALGTVIRVVGMAGGAILLFRGLELPGALVGAGALSAGVVLEAVGTRIMAWGAKDRLERSPQPERSAPPAAVSLRAEAKRASEERARTEGSTDETLTLRRISEFYFPLALTSLMALGVQPAITFFLGGSRKALDSLAVLPVIAALTFLFRSIGLSYQEAAIALLDGTRESFRRISLFAVMLGAAVTGGLGLIAFTPLARFYFEDLSGLSPELAEFSLLPLQLYFTIPLFSMQLAYQRAILVFGRATRAVTVSTAIEVATIVILLYLTIRVLDWVGAIAAVVALLAGRVVGNAYMFYACRTVLSATGMVGERAHPAPAVIAAASPPDVS